MPQGPPHTKGSREPAERATQASILWITLCSKIESRKNHSDNAVDKKQKMHIQQYIVITKTDRQTMRMISINVEKNLRE
ncbi:hypothetical protein CF104_02960 [Aeromonas jandaei]|nr:hypothetical protein CF104_02960 [Aeromonas jandaei]